MPAVVMSPCAACKILRRRCAEKCVLAPYFPPNDPIKFTTAHRVFGASNIIKFLQELPENQRADAVSSMLAKAQAEVFNMQCQHANIMALYCEMARSSSPQASPPQQFSFDDFSGRNGLRGGGDGGYCDYIDEDNSLDSFWDQLNTLGMSM
nr:LOB domain-containing protein 1-like [Ipomoea batatas]